MQQFVARQPIFNNKLHVHAYELLFRSNTIDGQFNFDPTQATSIVVNNGIFLVGLEKLTFAKPAFVNFSEQLLTSDLMTLLPKEKVVIEILETVAPTPKVMQACRKLKDLGYTIALDDFVYHPQLEPFIELADIIKVDFLLSPASYCQSIPKKFAKENIVFLAEKVETYNHFKQAVEWGYKLFQGYFFCKPDIISASDIQGNKLIYFKLLQELNNPGVAVDKLEQIIQKDVSLSYKLLKYINSASFSLKYKVSSIKQAIALIGTENLIKFVSLILLKGMSGDKPSELINTAIIRARFAELIASSVGLQKFAPDAFLVGLFSLLDALLDRPINEVLAELALKEHIQEALSRQPNSLMFILETVIAYEQADWERFDMFRNMIKLDSSIAKNLYMESVSWVWNSEK